VKARGVAGATSSTVAFNPYADNLRFLLGAYIIEDVIPTAWEVRLHSNQIRGLRWYQLQR
jgi:hypothetical protein